MFLFASVFVWSFVNIQFEYFHTDAIQPIVFQLVQSLLPQSRISKKALLSLNSNENVKKKFYSVNESRKSFMMVCQTEAEYKGMYDSKVTAESSVPPFISLIGSVFEPQYFMVDYDNISYKFFKFSRALEICFKTYYVFNIQHPEACDSICDFINKLFFKMKCDGAKTKPGTDALIREVECE